MSFESKYRPKFQKDLFVQPNDILEQIKIWLKSLDKNPQQILGITGPIGCGKTVVLEIILKSYNVYKIEPDSIKQTEIIDNIVDFRHSTFYETKGKMAKNIVLLENIELCDKNLNSFIETIHVKKNIKVPIILSTNNKKFMESLKERIDLCILNFSLPNENDIINLINKIDKAEKLKLNTDNINNIIQKSNFDFRQVLNILEQWHLQLKSNNTSVFQNFSNNVTSKIKDIDLLEKLDYMINSKNYDFDNTFNMAISEPHPISLGVYQNYIEQLNVPITDMSIISDVLSFSDNINNQIYKNQMWELYDTYAITGCVIPSYLLKREQNLVNVEIKQFKDTSYNFENSLRELHKLIIEENFNGKFIKQAYPNHIFTNLPIQSMFIIIKQFMYSIEVINKKFDGLKRGKNTSKREKIQLANTIKDDKLIEKNFNYLLDSIFSYRLFEVDWQYLKLNLSKLKDEQEMINYYEKIDLRIFKRLINIFSLDKTNKLLKSHTESAIKFHLCKMLIQHLEQTKLSSIEKIDNIDSMTQSLESIWNF